MDPGSAAGRRRAGRDSRFRQEREAHRGRLRDHAGGGVGCPLPAVRTDRVGLGGRRHRRGRRPAWGSARFSRWWPRCSRSSPPRLGGRWTPVYWAGAAVVVTRAAVRRAMARAAPAAVSAVRAAGRAVQAAGRAVPAAASVGLAGASAARAAVPPVRAHPAASIPVRPVPAGLAGSVVTAPVPARGSRVVTRTPPVSPARTDPPLARDRRREADEPTPAPLICRTRVPSRTTERPPTSARVRPTLRPRRARGPDPTPEPTRRSPSKSVSEAVRRAAPSTASLTGKTRSTM